MSELTDRIRAVLQAEEQVALACPPWPWRANAESDEVLADDDVQVAAVFGLSGNQIRATTKYIVRQDPQHTLDRIAAHRKIVDLYDTTHRIKSDIEARHPDGLIGDESRTYLNCHREMGVLQAIVEILADGYGVEVVAPTGS